MSNPTTLREKCRLVYPPCSLAEPAGTIEADAMTYFPELMERIARVVDLCMPTPHPTALDSGGEGGIAAHPALSSDALGCLRALFPVQGWLRNTLLERDPQTGMFSAPSSEEFIRRLEGAIETAKLAMEEVTECTLQLERYRVQLASWSSQMVDAGGGRVEVTASMVQQLEAFGVETQAGMVTPTEWVLMLAMVQRSLEQRWLASSVAHQVAYMSVLRAQLPGWVADALEKMLHRVREQIVPDEGTPLPAGLQWLDHARHNTLDAVWGVDAAR